MQRRDGPEPARGRDGPKGRLVGDAQSGRWSSSSEKGLIWRTSWRSWTVSKTVQSPMCWWAWLMLYPTNSHLQRCYGGVVTMKATAQSDCHSCRNVIESLIKLQPAQRPRPSSRSVPHEFRHWEEGFCVCLFCTCQNTCRAESGTCIKRQMQYSLVQIGSPY